MICTIPDCSSPVKYKGLCSKHYDKDYFSRNTEQREKQRLRQKKWREKNPDKVKAGNEKAKSTRPTNYYSILRIKRHGLTLDELNIIYESQNRSCAICQKYSEDAFEFSIDHDHNHCSGNYGCKLCVRGLLCSNCNSAIGMLQDSEEILLSAFRYLQMPRRYFQETIDAHGL